MNDHLNALPANHELNEYHIKSVIGSGGFGITYRARDNLGRVFAIKEYFPNECALRIDGVTVKAKSSSDQKDYQWGLKSFFKEACTLVTFDHPHLNKVHRYFKANGTAYMVLDLIEGETLAGVLKRRQCLNQAELLRLSKELLSGLKEVHNAGFVHRDIKPGNIMLRQDGSAVLLDFGAARQAMGQKSKAITAVLTPGYAPTEQYSQNSKRVGPWTDLYSLGMVMYRCISGISDQQLIDATERLDMKNEGKQHEDLAPAIVRGKGRYSESLLKAVDWAIEINRADRPQNISMFSAVLAGETQIQREETQPTPSQPDKGKTNSSSIIKKITVIAFLGLLGIGVWQFYIYLQADATLYQHARATNTLPDYQDYINTCQLCADRQQAQKQINIIKQQVKREKAKQAKAKRAEAKRQPIINSIGIKFIPIPAGTFRMGDIQGGGYSNEKPVHHINIKAFYISETEITQQQWQAVMGNNPSEFKNGDNYPVESVNWNDAQDYIQELNHQTGNHYRLPSEAEWEYAARAGSNTKYSWGNYITHNRANYGKNDDKDGLAESKDKWVYTSPVASFTPNAFGLYDMAGNVREWTQDCWNDTYAKAPTDGSAWESGDCAKRVVRGGSWIDNSIWVRSAMRFRYDVSSSSSSSFIGFRLIHDHNP